MLDSSHKGSKLEVKIPLDQTTKTKWGCLHIVLRLGVMFSLDENETNEIFLADS